MPATPPANATTTTLQVGTYTPLTDTFTSVCDMNDRAVFWLQNNGLKMPQPQKTIVRSGNIRASGQRVPVWQYGNRHIQVSIRLRGASTSAMLASIRTLLQAIEQPPYVLRIAFPGATAYTYADVVACTHNIPSDPLLILNGVVKDIAIDFECYPGLRGGRLWLQNLIPNPGFEAPSGPAVPVFDDNLATLNAYAVQAGGALSQELIRYTDVIFSDTPLRYYRLNEATGTTTYNAINQTANNGTIGGGVTLNQTGALAGDPDGAMAFDGSTGGVYAPITGLPSGNAAWSIEAWVYLTGTTNTFSCVAGFGNPSTAHAFASIRCNGATVYADTGSAGTATQTITTNAWHHVAATWDGTTLLLYVDGTQVQSATPGAASIGTTDFYIGYDTTTGHYFAGTIDEVAVYSTTLSAARITAHYNAGHTAPATAMSNSLLIPASGRVSFGSPAWGAYNQWQVRFRYLKSQSAFWYLHYTDANNCLYVGTADGAFNVVQIIGGTTHTLNSGSTPHMVDGDWYWLQVTQFPTVSGNPPLINANLFTDSSGAVGANIASASVTTYDSVTALAGQPQVACLNAALAIGGNYSQVHKVWLFGPGGWYVNNGGTGQAVGAWELDTSLTYPNGPVTSFGCARLDAPPAGTWLANWNQDAYGTSAQGWMPVTKGGQVGISLAYNAVGVSATAYQGVWIYEYDANGNNIGSNIQALQHTGPTSGWTVLSGTYTLQNANTTQIAIVLRAADPTAGASASGYVLFDNVQVWDITKTGQTSMPYCELRFPQSPAQLLVSGIQGDMPAPALLAYGTYFYRLPAGQWLAGAIGRRAKSSANAQMVANSIGFYGSTLSPQSTAYLDANSYGGYYVSAALANGWNPRAFNFHPDDLDGTFHHIARLYTTQTTNFGSVYVRPTFFQRLLPWYGNASSYAQSVADVRWQYYGGYVYPFSASSTWTVCDAGQIVSPPPAEGGLADSSQTWLTTLLQLQDTNTGGSTGQAGWQLLLPIDGPLLMAKLVNPSNAASAITNSWLWSYADPLGTPGSPRGAWGYSVETAAAVDPAASAGGAGTSGTGFPNINPSADPWLTLDPALSSNGQQGVNQLAGYLSDTNGDILPLYAEIAYSPLYLYPR